ncbi:MAG: sigma 54-interacting transcriptional regulator [Myxococcales bacterium]
MVNAARSAAPLLLIGEAGSGKGAIARLVHELSPRADMPFVRLDCGAISASDFEAELVGFERIAVTGATRDRDGLLQAANKECGVVLGDGKCVRVGDLPVAIQKLAKETSREEESVQVIEVVEACGGEDEAIARRCIVEAMKKTGADRNAVARLLGMTRRTLAYRIALYGLDVELGELAALPT